MTRDDRATGEPYRFTDEELAFVQTHITELRSNASGPHYVYWGLAISFVIGLGAHIGGYLLGQGTPPEPIGLLANLLYALGWSLWTGVILVLFVEVVPEAKRRGLRQYLDDYAATQHDRSRTSSDLRPGMTVRRPRVGSQTDNVRIRLIARE